MFVHPIYPSRYLTEVTLPYFDLFLQTKQKKSRTPVKAFGIISFLTEY